MDYPFLGLMTLSAVLKKNKHESDALIGENIEDFDAILQAESPDAIAFSVMTGMHQWALRLGKELKQIFPALPIIWGGPHATFNPKTIENDGVDVICRGEADEAILDIARALDLKTLFDFPIPNLWLKRKDGIIKNEVRPLIHDLDTLPFPDRSLYRRYPDIGSSTTQVFMASRGCPFDCTFCFNHQLKRLYRNKGSLVRYRTVRNLLDEIKDVAARQKVKNVYLNDDTLILNKKWIEEFTELYPKEIGLPFTCLIRADLADENIIDKMAGAGCRSVFFGIESGNETLRNELLKKSISDRQIHETARLLKKYKIKYRTYNILGLPGETLEDAFQTVQMNIDIKTDFPWCALFMPYPGTELGKRSKEMGLISESFSDNDVQCTFHSDSVLKSKCRREIENLHKFFQTAILFPWTFPIIKKLIKLPQNKLFVLWFTLIYGFIFIRSEARGWGHTILFGLKNIKHLAPALNRRK